MKILIIYYLLKKGDRNTIDEHLYAFKKYSHESCFHLNAAYGVPEFLSKVRFDLVIFHYTFWSNFRWLPPERWHELIHKYDQLTGYKVAVPQDEYQNTAALNRLFKDLNLKTVFTCLPESEWQKVYPQQESGLEHYITVFPGYIDDGAREELEKANQKPHRSRPIDIGYRARKVPYWIGSHGLVKWQLTERFLCSPVNQSLKLDLSNDPKDVFYGRDWYKFLSRCRVVLGCESGANLHDPTGEIMEKVDRYVAEHPGAYFKEVETACFPGLDGNLKLFSLSPRHFEACITRTCQALVEGEYGGIFKPGIHYIEIRKDWSNIPEVIRQIEDIEFCENMAERAYRDIVQPGMFTYRTFVRLVLEHVKSVNKPTSSSLTDDLRYARLLDLREKYPAVLAPAGFFTGFIKGAGYKLLVKLGWYEAYLNVKAKLK